MQHCTQVSLWSSVEDLVRTRVREFVEEVVEQELTEFLERSRYERGGAGYRNGRRERTLVTTTGTLKLSVPRGRLNSGEGDKEFRSSVLPKGRRLTPRTESLIVATYLCGVSTRNVELALTEALGAGVSKSSVSRALASLRPQFEAWKQRDLTNLKVKRLILDGFGVPVRMDGKSHRLTILVAIGIREDGTKEVLALHAMASESKQAWLEILEDLSSRGVKGLDLVVGDGSKGLEAAIAEVWANVLVQRCTVHKERNLLAHAPEGMHEELKAEYSRMMYADTAEQALELRRAFLNKWRAKCPGVARSLEEAGDRLFTFLRFPPSQWKGIRTTNAIERLNEEFRRRVKVQGLEPGGDSVCMLFWALLASGKVVMRKAVGYESLNEPIKEELRLAA